MPFSGENGWPSEEDLKRRLNVDDTSVHDEEVGVILAAGIAWAKRKAGDWHESDAPTDELAEAALARAVELGSDVMPPSGERKSEALLYGQRRRFGIG